MTECGNGTTDAPGEQCDDSNQDNFDGCSATCQNETYYTIGGEVTGLDLGETVTLVQGADTEIVTGADAVLGTPDPFTFTTGILNGTLYYVSHTASAVVSKICRIDDLTQTGYVQNTNVTNVTINCTPIVQYPIGGAIIGLANAKQVDVQLGAGPVINVIGGGTGVDFYEFTLNPQDDGTVYQVFATAISGGISCSIPVAPNNFLTGTINGGPVSSVDFFCGGGMDKYELDDTKADADTANGNGLISSIEADGIMQVRSLDVAADTDYMQLNVTSTNQAYTIKLFTEEGGSACTLSMVLDLFGTDGTTNLRKSYAPGGLGGCSTISYKFATTGIYYIRVYEGLSATGNYGISVKKEALVLFEPFIANLGAFTTNDNMANPGPWNVWNHSSMPGMPNHDASHTNWVPFKSDGSYVAADSQVFGGAIDTYLTSKKLNCTPLTNVRLEFDVFFWFDNAADAFIVEVMSSNTAGWELVPGADFTGTDLNYEHLTFDISTAAAGVNDLQIRFLYQSNGAFWEVMLDNVIVVGD